MHTVHLDVLGPPILVVDGAPVHVETRKALALLAHLVIEGPQRRDSLDVLLWPESDGQRARQALRRTLSAIRKVAPDALSTEGDDVALAVEMTTDLDEVEALVPAGQTLDPDVAGRVDALHRGEFLEGLHFRDADPFEHWRRETAEHVARRHARLLERWASAHVARQEFTRAIDVVQRRLAMDPLHEPSHQHLMLLHAWLGDRGAAARQYATCIQVLDEELGVAPLPRTTALDRAIRAGTIDPPPGRAPEAPEQDGRGDDPGGHAAAPSIPFVGRHDQLTSLLDLHRSCTADGAVALVIGEAGIGKTRLTSELADRVDGRVLRVAPHPGESSLAYAPITSFLREAGERVQQLDPAVREELARLAPDVVGVRPPEHPLTSPGARARLVDACATALMAMAAGPDGPGLLLIDDVDRADPETRELVRYLANRLAGHPLLVVVTSRESIDLPAPDTRLVLPRLTEQEVRDIAAARGVQDARTTARLHAESEGVPFLVVSYLAARAEGDEDWHLPSDGRDLVRGRLERLDEVARQVLAAAAVLGGAQPPDVLERVSGRGEDELVEAIETLAAEGLLAETDGGAYRLTHDKIRTVAIEETSRIRRRLLHHRAADVLTTTSPAVAAATLAYHLEQAGREAEAATAHAAAGRRAAELYANGEAIDHLEAALAMGHADPAALLMTLGDLLVRTGAYAKAASRYTRAAAHGAAEADVEERLGSLALRQGDDAEAQDHLTQALAAEPNAHRRVDILAGLARAHAGRDDLEAAADRSAEAVAVATRESVPPAALARAHNVAGLVARRRQDAPAARTHLRASLEAATGVEQRAAALNNLALVLGEEGDLTEALVVAREALDAGRATGDLHREAALLNNLADLLHAAGRTEEALGLQREAAERFAGVGDAPMTSPEIWRLVDW